MAAAELRQRGGGGGGFCHLESHSRSHFTHSQNTGQLGVEIHIRKTFITNQGVDALLLLSFFRGEIMLASRMSLLIMKLGTTPPPPLSSTPPPPPFSSGTPMVLLCLHLCMRPDHVFSFTALFFSVRFRPQPRTAVCTGPSLYLSTESSRQVLPVRLLFDYRIPQRHHELYTGARRNIGAQERERKDRVKKRRDNCAWSKFIQCCTHVSETGRQ